MQLKIQRSQRAGGVLGNTVLFCLDVRADYARDEAANIAKYKLSQQVIYNSRAAERHLQNAGTKLDRASDKGADVKGQMSGLVGGIYSLAMAKMNLNISIASLGRGHHIECKDLSELMDAEEAVMQACRNLRDYLRLAATFNGSTTLVDFSSDDEQVHTAMGQEVYSPPPALATVTEPASRAQVVEAEYTEEPRFLPGTVGAAYGSGEPFAVTIKNWVVKQWPEVARFYQEHLLSVRLGMAFFGLVLVWWLMGPVVAVIAACIAIPVGFGMLLRRS